MGLCLCFLLLTQVVFPSLRLSFISRIRINLFLIVFTGKTCHFSLVTPASWWDEEDKGEERGEEGGEEGAASPYRPVVVLLAGTGEQGFHRRHQTVAIPLAKAGVACIVHESAYYGYVNRLFRPLQYR